MSAQAQMRAMLDQLMGTSRDGDSTRQRIKFDNDRVCKSHLLSCCPHDVLAGTRMDLGECQKVHDLALRADYEIASKQHDYFFELDAMDHLNSFIANCDQRTEVAKKRLAETQDEISAEVAVKAEKVHELNEEIGKLLAKAEQQGAEGNVDESQKVMDEVETVRANKRDAEEIYRNSMPASSYQQQKLRVCEVCSAYLGLQDNDRRLADHFGGKLHLGFIEIREKLEELRRVVTEKQEKRNQDRLKRREEREKEEREKLRYHLPILSPTLLPLPHRYQQPILFPTPLSLPQRYQQPILPPTPLPLPQRYQQPILSPTPLPLPQRFQQPILSPTPLPLPQRAISRSKKRSRSRDRRRHRSRSSSRDRRRRRRTRSKSREKRRSRRSRSHSRSRSHKKSRDRSRDRNSKSK